jgi:peptidase E
MLHLIGGGPGGITQTRRHIHDAMRELGKKKSLVAYVGAASGDNLGFQKMLSAVFLGTGARVEGVKLVAKRASAARARELLSECDVVFMSGGDVEAGMQVLRDRDVAGLLRELAAGGKPFIGISAGSIMCGQKWVRFPDEDDDSTAEPFDCLGLAPLTMDAHSEDDDWDELRLLLRLLGPGAIGYGVPSRGCLRVDAAGKLSARGDRITRLRHHQGSVITDSPLDAGAD